MKIVVPLSAKSTLKELRQETLGAKSQKVVIHLLPRCAIVLVVRKPPPQKVGAHAEPDSLMVHACAGNN